jgi:hypothetical protein
VSTLDYEKLDGLVCQRCGVRSGERHRGEMGCIEALREVIAGLQLRSMAQAPAENTLQKGKPSRRGGFRVRKDARMVMLGGERISLTEAARRLGITASTLHWRIVNRTRTSDYVDVDIRAIGADIVGTPGGPAEVTE